MEVGLNTFFFYTNRFFYYKMFLFLSSVMYLKHYVVRELCLSGLIYTFYKSNILGDVCDDFMGFLLFLFMKYMTVYKINNKINNECQVTLPKGRK